MLSLPNMLLLGSMGRDAGKTTLATAVIHRLAESSPEMAIAMATTRSATDALTSTSVKPLVRFLIICPSIALVPKLKVL